MTIYLHLDLDAFFASVEELFHPEYHYLPLIVGGKFENSVCCSANYVARSYGVKAGMPAFMYKKLLPKNYVVVNTHHELYQKISSQIFNHIKNQYCKNILIYSIDECWLTVQINNSNPFEIAKRLAQQIQDDILKTFQLSISIGVSYSMFLAKMASDLKKPMGIMLIENLKDVKNYLWPLKIEKMFMVGKQLAKKLNKVGIFNIGDLAQFQDEHILQTIFNKNYGEYLANANGRILNYSFRHEKPKTMSVKQTFGVANTDDVILQEEMRWMCWELVHNLYKNHASVLMMEIYLEFSTHQVNKLTYNFTQPTSEFKDIHQAAQVLFENAYDQKDLIRSLCFRFPKLIYLRSQLQLSFDDQVYKEPEKKKNLQWQMQVVNLINKKEKDEIANLPFNTFDKNKKAFNH